MIRFAESRDIPEMLAMGREFHKVSGAHEYSEWDDASFRDTLLHLMDAEDSVVFAMEEDGQVIGMSAGTEIPLFYNRHNIIANEVFCWVNPEKRAHGTQLLEAVEEWALKTGTASTVVLSRVPGMRDEAMDRYYKGRGYKLGDVSYYKELYG